MCSAFACGRRGGGAHVRPTGGSHPVAHSRPRAQRAEMSSLAHGEASGERSAEVGVQGQIGAADDERMELGVLGNGGAIA